MIDLLLLAFLIYLYSALRKERKRVQILSHFVSGVIYYSVDTAGRAAPENVRQSASRFTSTNETSNSVDWVPSVVWDACFNRMLERIYREFDNHYGAVWMWEFAKRDQTLFDRRCSAGIVCVSDGGFTTLYRRFHQYVYNELQPIMTKTEG
ncbi:MAG: hypothetical protein ABSC05_01690 [Candidatus Solibacter sp.]